MKLKKVEKRENRQGIRLFFSKSRGMLRKMEVILYVLLFHFDQKKRKLLMTLIGSIDQRQKPSPNELISD